LSALTVDTGRRQPVAGVDAGAARPATHRLGPGALTLRATALTRAAPALTPSAHPLTWRSHRRLSRRRAGALHLGEGARTCWRMDAPCPEGQGSVRALLPPSHIRHPRPRPEGRAHTRRRVRRTRWRPGTGAPCPEAQGGRGRRDSRVYGPRDAARRATRVRRMPPPHNHSQSQRRQLETRFAVWERQPATAHRVKASRSRSPSIITASINAACGRV